jgi:hypothetical protein
MCVVLPAQVESDDLMAFSIDDEWENGPMLRRAGVAAFGLYCACGLWVARHTTDGFVPADVAADYGTREWAAKLVDAGLWRVVEGGYHMPHYLDRNPSAEKVRRRREADAERKARWREAQSRRASRRESGGSHGVTPHGFRASVPPPKGGKARGEPLRAVPDWCGRCHKDTRIFVTDFDEPIPCPSCHPNAEASA